MGCGTSIIAHDNPFNREVLGDCGRYFGDVAELIERLDQATDASERARLMTATRERIEQRYTWDRIADAYATLPGATRRAAATASEAA